MPENELQIYAPVLAYDDWYDSGYRAVVEHYVNSTPRADRSFADFQRSPYTRSGMELVAALGEPAKTIDRDRFLALTVLTTMTDPAHLVQVRSNVPQLRYTRVLTFDLCLRVGKAIGVEVNVTRFTKVEETLERTLTGPNSDHVTSPKSPFAHWVEAVNDTCAGAPRAQGQRARELASELHKDTGGLAASHVIAAGGHLIAHPQRLGQVVFQLVDDTTTPEGRKARARANERHGFASSDMLTRAPKGEALDAALDHAPVYFARRRAAATGAVASAQIDFDERLIATLTFIVSKERQGQLCKAAARARKVVLDEAHPIQCGRPHPGPATKVTRTPISCFDINNAITTFERINGDADKLPSTAVVHDWVTEQRRQRGLATPTDMKTTAAALNCVGVALGRQTAGQSKAEWKLRLYGARSLAKFRPAPFLYEEQLPGMTKKRRFDAVTSFEADGCTVDVALESDGGHHTCEVEMYERTLAEVQQADTEKADQHWAYWKSRTQKAHIPLLVCFEGTILDKPATTAWFFDKLPHALETMLEKGAWWVDIVKEGAKHRAYPSVPVETVEVFTYEGHDFHVVYADPQPNAAAPSPLDPWEALEAELSGPVVQGQLW